MKVLALFLAVVALAATTEGSPGFQSGRCKCLGTMADFIPRRLIGRVEVLPATTTCDRTEIIITLKGSKEERCLNPATQRMQAFVTKFLGGRIPHGKDKKHK
ncbi:hypothetical protein MATL_G00091740 [Megalops atlanticus]|uniref:C-X-C motif chemokine n=1 Tax=Megalops atlanticus TaxID=7932 RepID=A0A9D3Q967_MEGAT|nr:hypothetical protein MATL_G00091740 [Megalops atlanticus]